MTKEQIITTIHTAFKDVKLEDGVGLWEGQGLDDYADDATITAYKKRDERLDWTKIPYKELAYAYSSLSFFDADGMRFCLPQFLIFDILHEEIYAAEGVYSPDVVFTLGYDMDSDYQKKRFSLLNKAQIACIVDYLRYKLKEMAAILKSHKYSKEDMEADFGYNQIKMALEVWEKIQKHPPQ